jgi:hypothetical protein
LYDSFRKPKSAMTFSAVSVARAASWVPLVTKTSYSALSKKTLEGSIARLGTTL